MDSLSSEVEIMNKVPADWSKPLVSFLCTSFNQKDYIEQTIKGFLSQETTFPYEIVIHDDASTDGTQDIIKHYKEKYPNIIKVIIQNENKYSQGISTILLGLALCNSDYIALCEGDDYWISKQKVERQLKLMMSDPDIMMVVSPGKMEINGKISPNLHCYYGSEVKVMTAQNVLNVPRQFAPTASYLIKKECLIKSIEIFNDAPVGDLFMELYAAVTGKLVYHPGVGSVYRAMAKNSWSESMSKNALKNNINFVNSMELTINESRAIPGFEELDWSIKLSGMYYTLAIYYLKEKDVEGFTKAIEKSCSYGMIARQQKILYYCKDYMSFLLLFIEPATMVRNVYRRVLNGF